MGIKHTNRLTCLGQYLASCHPSWKPTSLAESLVVAHCCSWNCSLNLSALKKKMLVSFLKLHNNLQYDKTESFKTRQNFRWTKKFWKRKLVIQLYIVFFSSSDNQIYFNLCQSWKPPFLTTSFIWLFDPIISSDLVMGTDNRIDLSWQQNCKFCSEIVFYSVKSNYRLVTFGVYFGILKPKHTHCEEQRRRDNKTDSLFHYYNL